MSSPPNHIALSQQLRSIPRVTRDEDNTDHLLSTLSQESPHSVHRHAYPRADTDTKPLKIPSGRKVRRKSSTPSTPTKRKSIRSFADAPIFCYLCGKKYPLRNILAHHEDCLNTLLEFNPNALVPKPPESPIPDLPPQKLSRSSIGTTRSKRSSSIGDSSSSLVSSFSTGSSSNSSSPGASSSTSLTNMALRIYNAEAREIYYTKRPQEPDVEKKFMTPEMRHLMNESLDYSMSSSANDLYDETWTAHATSSLRKNSPANKKHMLQNKVGYRVGSGYGVDIYPPETLMRAPVGFYGHSTVYCDRGLLISFGGYEKKSKMHPIHITNKLRTFQIDMDGKPPQRKRTSRFQNSGKWREIQPLNHSSELVAPRAFHTTVSFSNRLYVYGGEGLNGEVLGDLWCYDLDFKQWAKVAIGIPSKPRPLRKENSAHTLIASSPLASSSSSEISSPPKRKVSSTNSMSHTPNGRMPLSNSMSSPSIKKKRRSSVATPPPNDSDSVTNPGLLSPVKVSSPRSRQDRNKKSIIDARFPPCLKHHSAVISFRQKFSQKDIPAMPIKRRKRIQKLYMKTKDPFCLQNQPDAPNVVSGSRKMVIYGGITEEGTICRDIWEFDMQSRQWFGTRGPPGRYGHSAVFYAEDNKMVIFGGRNAEGEFLNDVWIYDCSTNVFEKANVNHMDRESTPLAVDEYPCPRAFHSCVIDRNLMFVVGGYSDQKKECNDIWVLDLYNYRWTKLAHSRAFHTRVHSQLCRINEDQFAMMGGMTLPKEQPERASMLIHFPDPEDEENIDEQLLVHAGSHVGSDEMERHINDIVSDMLSDHD